MRGGIKMWIKLNVRLHHHWSPSWGSRAGPREKSFSEWLARSSAAQALSSVQRTVGHSWPPSAGGCYVFGNGFSLFSAKRGGGLSWLQFLKWRRGGALRSGSPGGAGCAWAGAAGRSGLSAFSQAPPETNLMSLVFISQEDVRFEKYRAAHWECQPASKFICFSPRIQDSADAESKCHINIDQKIYNQALTYDISGKGITLLAWE